MRHKKNFWLLFLWLGLLVSTGLSVHAGPNQNADILVELKDFSSEELTVAVVVVGVIDLDSYDFKLCYNSQKLVAKDIKEGPFLSSLGGTTFFQKDLSKKGEIWLSNSLAGKDTAIAPDGDGEVVYITFGFLSEDRNVNQDLFSFKDVYFWDSEINEDIIKK